MVEKTGAAKANPVDTEEAPAEPFIPATDYGAETEKAPPPKPNKSKKPAKTEHTQMDIEDYLQVLQKLGVKDDKRENFFGRLLVRTFEHKLASPGETPQDTSQLPRSALPGFFMVLHILLGRSLIESYQETTRDLIERVNGGLDNINWDKVYGNEEAKLISIDALVALAMHLENIEESMSWFVDLVNDNTKAPNAKIPAEELNWKFTDAAYRDLVKDLFAELRDVISTETGRLQITKRHGAETCIKLVEFMAQLDTLGD